MLLYQRVNPDDPRTRHVHTKAEGVLATGMKMLEMVHTICKV